MAKGRGVLGVLKSFQVSKWFTKEIERLAVEVADQYRTRAEIFSATVITAGTNPTTTGGVVAKVNISAGTATLNGVLHATPAVSDKDLFTDNAGNKIRTPIFSDGSSAAALSMSTGQVEFVTVVYCNSDNAGGVAAVADAAIGVYVAVCAGTASARGTAHLSSKQISDALLASTFHGSADLRFTHVGRVKLVEANSGAAAGYKQDDGATNGFTTNRNNCLNV
jgi:hypothetical protein